MTTAKHPANDATSVEDESSRPRRAQESAVQESAVQESALWSPQRRNFTIGLVLIVTLIAFEAMGLATALPTMVRDLDAERWYSWAFTVFMATSVVGTVLGGTGSDRRGPVLPLLLSLPGFAAGLVIAGVANSISVLLAARALQGLAAGSLIVAMYVLIARVYPEQHHPKAFAALSAAWVLPALLGPTVAGLLTTYLSWRWVFLGLAPLVLLAALLLVPTVRKLGGGSGAAAPVRARLPLAALGAATGVVVLNWTAQYWSWLAAALGLAAVVALGLSLRVILPVGTLTGRAGIPAMVLARGLLAGVFFAAQAFIPPTLAIVHGYSPATAGIPLTIGALGWSTAAFLQSRMTWRSRESMVACGLVLVAAAVASLLLVAPAWGPHWLIFASWCLGGAGMGLGTASTSVRVLSLSPEAERGYNSSALQISGMLGQAILVGAGGVVVTSVASMRQPTAGVAVLAVLLATIALVGAGVLGRARAQLAGAAQ